MRAYIAGWFDAREELKPIRAAINDMGHFCRSTWMDEHDDITPKYEWQELAARDLREINESDMLICDTHHVSTRGGAATEYGYALAKGKRCWVVGPQRSVFHFLADRHFDTWAAALEALNDVVR